MSGVLAVLEARETWNRASWGIFIRSGASVLPKMEPRRSSTVPSFATSSNVP